MRIYILFSLKLTVCPLKTRPWPKGNDPFSGNFAVSFQGVISQHPKGVAGSPKHPGEASVPVCHRHVVDLGFLKKSSRLHGREDIGWKCLVCWVTEEVFGTCQIDPKAFNLVTFFNQIVTWLVHSNIATAGWRTFQKQNPTKSYSIITVTPHQISKKKHNTIITNHPRVSPIVKKTATPRRHDHLRCSMMSVNMFNKPWYLSWSCEYDQPKQQTLQSLNSTIYVHQVMVSPI